jgi:hypothetical protein
VAGIPAGRAGPGGLRAAAGPLPGPALLPRSGAGVGTRAPAIGPRLPLTGTRSRGRALFPSRTLALTWTLTLSRTRPLAGARGRPARAAGPARTTRAAWVPALGHGVYPGTSMWATAPEPEFVSILPVLRFTNCSLPTGRMPSS